MSTMITRELWAKISKEPYDKWVPLLEDLLPDYGINTPRRIAMFLAQAAHESGGFSHLVENLNYSAAGLAKTWPKRYAVDGVPNELARKIQRNPELIANATYANRMGNGAPESGDGWRYRGRGIFQLTGKRNYEDFFKATQLKINPEDLLQPKYAIISACWYWNTRNCNQYADKNDIKGCTVAINGGTIGLAHRSELYETIRKAI